MNTRVGLSVGVIILAMFGGLEKPVSAATLTWDGGAGTTNWWDANNWSGNALPGIADTVNLTASVATTPAKQNLTFSGWGSGDTSVGGLRLNLNSGAALHVLGTLWVGYGDNGPTPPAVNVTQNAGSLVTVDQWLNVGYYTDKTDNQYTLNGGTLKIGASLQREYSAGRNEGLVFQGGTLQVATIAASVSNQTQSASAANSVLDVTANNTTLNVNYTAAEPTTANTASILVGASRILTLGTTITLSLGRNAQLEVSGTLTGGSGSVLVHNQASEGIRIGDGGVLSVPTASLTGGTGQAIRYNGTTTGGTISSSVVMSGAHKTFNVDDGAAAEDLTIAGAISQSGGTYGLIKAGAGTLILSGVNTFAGGLVVSNGTAVLSGGAAVYDTCRVTVVDAAGAAVALTASETIGSLAGGGASGGTVALGANTLTVGGDGTSMTFAGVIGGAGSLTKVGTGFLVLNGANSYSGGTAIGNGTTANLSTTDTATAASTGFIVVGDNAALGTGPLSFGGAQLRAGVAGLTLANNYTLSAGALRFSGAYDLTLGGAGVLDAARGLGNYGTATLVLGGTLALGVNALYIDAGTVTVNGTISGTGSLNVRGLNSTPFVTLGGVNTYSGGTTITSGRLTIAATGLLGSGSYAGAIANAGALVYAGTAAQTLGGIISGVGSVTMAGSGTLTLSAANTYTGGTRVDGGALVLPAGGLSGIIRGRLTINSGAVVHAATAWSLGNGDDSQVVTNITLNGGVLSFTGSDGLGGYTGYTIAMTGGSISNGFQLGGNRMPSITTSASSLPATIDGFLMRESLSQVTLNVAAGTVPDGVDLVVGALSQNGANNAVGILKTGAGTLKMIGSSSYTGVTQVNGGALVLPAGGLSGTIRGRLTINSGAVVHAATAWAFGYGADSQVVTNITLNGGVLNFTGAPGSGGYAGYTIAMTGGSISNGFQLGGGLGSCTTPTITTSASSLPATIDGFLMRENLSQVTFNVASGTVPGGADLVVGALSQNGANAVGIVKTGAGTLRMNGNSTYTGSTTVNAGVLLVDGSLAAGTALAVGGTGRLAGTGTVSRAVNVTAGTIAPGDPAIGSGVGTLTAGTTDIAAGGVLAVQITPSTSDLLVSTGTLDVQGATLSVSATGSVMPGYPYLIASAGSVSGEFAGLSDGSTFRGGTSWFQIQYSATSITLTPATAGSGTVYSVR